MERVPLDPNGLPLPLVNLDIPLSDVSVRGNVRQELAEVLRGITGVFTDAGSPLSPGESATVLEVLGKGTVAGIEFLSKNPSYPMLTFLLDSSYTYAYMRNPSDVRRILGGTGRLGFAELLRYDDANSEYALYYDLSALGSFGESCLVEVSNPHSEEHPCYVAVWYSIKSSEWFEVPNPEIFPSLVDLRNRLCEEIPLRKRDISLLKRASREGGFRVFVIIHRTITEKEREAIEQILGGGA